MLMDVDVSIYTHSSCSKMFKHLHRRSGALWHALGHRASLSSGGGTSAAWREGIGWIGLYLTMVNIDQWIHLLMEHNYGKSTKNGQINHL